MGWAGFCGLAFAVFWPYDNEIGISRELNTTIITTVIIIIASFMFITTTIIIPTLRSPRTLSFVDLSGSRSILGKPWPCDAAEAVVEDHGQDPGSQNPQTLNHKL